jgi:hypothetical protein
MSSSDPRRLEPIYDWYRNHKYELYHVQFVVGGSDDIEIPDDLTIRYLNGNLDEWQRWYEDAIRPI